LFVRKNNREASHTQDSHYWCQFTGKTWSVREPGNVVWSFSTLKRYLVKIQEAWMYLGKSTPSR
jgi:hypothetical protein